MSDKKIRDLPAAVSVNTTDIFEKTNDPSGVPVSQKATGQQFLDFIGVQAPLSLTSVSVGSGKILLNVDGSASFSTGNVLIHSDGSAGFAGNNAQIAVDGSLNIGFGLATIQAADGSVAFGGGAFSVSAVGTVSIVGLSFLNNDGSASFGSGGLNIDATGNLSVGSGANALNADGSASFASSNVTIAADGTVTLPGLAIFNPATNLQMLADLQWGPTSVLLAGTGEIDAAGYKAGGVPGITQDVTVLTALPNTFSTLHFTNGLLTSVT